MYNLNTIIAQIAASTFPNETQRWANVSLSYDQDQVNGVSRGAWLMSGWVGPTQSLQVNHLTDDLRQRVESL